MGVLRRWLLCDSLSGEHFRTLWSSGSIFSEDGAVYVWGSGGEGQLGMGGKTECPDPEELRIEEGVTCISCGYYHTALVSGRCYLDVL